MKSKKKILVSACLAGVNCKYNGRNNENSEVLKLLEKEDVILVCPEQLGGLPPPRPCAEIKDNKVITNENRDVTCEYMKGAKETLNIAKKYHVKKAILKSKSPSCGKGTIYDGTFSGKLIDGNGITTSLLLQNHIEVISSDEFQMS
ncbi:MAG: DUF523 domain-containing protein [Clostridia bacterium]|nr:DUF523 domain-containing protein [Clostridia bacterium]